MNKSAMAFMSETQEMETKTKQNLNLIETIENKDINEFIDLWENLYFDQQQQLTSDNSQEDLKRLNILDFKLHFWFMVKELHPEYTNSKEISKTTKNSYSEFLNKRGKMFSESPEMLPYFVVQYIPQPANNDLFKKAFTKEWKEELISEIKYFFKTKQINNEKTKLETCISNFSKFVIQSQELFPEKYSKSFVDKKTFLVKSFDNNNKKKDLKKESLSFLRGDLSELQSCTVSEVNDVKRKMFEYKLMLEQKEHFMKKKEWESKECLQQSHKRWIFFVK